MSGHGPESMVFEKASNAELKPAFVGKDGMAFMWETYYLLQTTTHSLEPERVD